MSKQLVGFCGSFDGYKKIMKFMDNTNDLGDMHKESLKTISPKLGKDLIVGDTQIRQLSSRLNESLPVNKYSGKKVKDQEEASLYYEKIANEKSPTWAVDIFVYSDFFRQPDSTFFIFLSKEEYAKQLKSKSGFDFVKVMVYDTEEEMPAGNKDIGIVIGKANGAALKKKLTNLKEKVTEAFKK